ncbi:hypothetical protein [Terriglobus sp.]|uniref:hypothetical protein n=1 Tax=Terriglobus sp. TaxID=1889013 RepID=UPI003B00A3BE
MRLDDPRLGPGETEEQRQERLVKAAKWNKIARESRALANRSALAGRMIRLVLLAALGVALTAVGIHNFDDPGEMANTKGFGNQHFGPHGNAICFTAFGLLIVGVSVFFLVRYVRRARSLPNYTQPTA